MQCLARTYLKAVLNELTVLAVSGALEYLVASVTLVAEQRVSYMLHVYPDLGRSESGGGQD